MGTIVDNGVVIGMHDREAIVIGAPVRFETSWIIDPKHVTWSGRVDFNQSDFMWPEFFNEQQNDFGNSRTEALNKYAMPYNLTVDWASEVIADETGTYILVTGRRRMGGFEGPNNSRNVAYYINTALEII